MNRGPLVKIAAPDAAQICAQFDLKPEARQLLKSGMPPDEFLAALIGKKRYVDAIDFLSFALPPREGLWWGCLCMQHAYGDQLSVPERAAAIAAVEWVLRPTEENRAAAKAPAETAGPAVAAGALAMAAAVAGSVQGAKSVSAAVKLACTKSEPIKMTAVQRAYVELGLDIAEGRVI